MDKGEKAKSYFEQGYGCAQAVLLAFKEEIGLDEDSLSKIGSGLGGGVARMRETCGTVVGMAIALGLIRGKTLMDGKEKGELYKEIQTVANKFRNENGSIVCAELLGIKRITDDPRPSDRTAEYYKKRPCPILCRDMANFLDEYLKTGK